MVSSEFLNFFYNSEDGWIDGTTYFVNIMKSYCKPGSTVMDLGAGAGEGKPDFYCLRDNARFVVGLDSDSEIQKNSIVDFKVLGSAYFLPFKEDLFDFIYADFVLEHIVNPDAFIGELSRVLRKDGCFVFRTPNIYHYAPLIASVTPARFQSLFANFVRSIDKGQKTFPVVYKMNTAGCLEKLFEQNGFVVERMELIEREPSYLVFNSFAFLLGVLYERIVNSAEMLRHFRSNIIGVFRKA